MTVRVAETLDLAVAVDDFLRHLRLERGCAEGTVRAYGYELRRLLCHLEGRGLRGVSALTFANCRPYIAGLVEAGKRPKTVHLVLASIRGLVRYLADEGVLTEDWGRKLSAPKVVERRSDPLTAEEARRLLAAIDRHTLTGQRDHALFALFLDTGLRIREMLNLTLADVRLDDGYLVVRQGKGGKDRVVPLRKDRIEELRHYLRKVRPALAQRTSTDHFWLSVFGSPLAQTSCRDRLRYYARLAGLSGHRVYPHRLRATFATRLDREGITITVIQELMGHSDVKTTARYVGVTGKEMRAAVERMAPVE